MNKYIIQSILFASLFALTGCSENISSGSEIENVSLHESVSINELKPIEYYKAQIEQCGGSIPDELIDTALIIQSEKDFSKLSDSLKKRHFNLDEMFDNLYSEKESDFYDKYVLLIGMFESGAMVSTEFNSITINENILTINIDCYAPDGPTIDEIDSRFCFCIIERNKMEDWSILSCKINEK